MAQCRNFSAHIGKAAACISVNASENFLVLCPKSRGNRVNVVNVQPVSSFLGCPN
jgi:hypothetical protein